MKRLLRRGCWLGILGLWLGGSAGSVAAQSGLTARDLLGRMSPAQRVGQLLLVPFHGSDVADDSDIARLIDEGFVGGVILDPANANFANLADAPAQVARLTNALQARAAAAQGPFAPLLVTLTPDGPFPYAALHGGMTPWPSPMALGATWDTGEAARVGELVGRELSAVGVNCLLGPSLDVVSVPRPGSSGDLGARVFGGSPYWVGRFGRAYVEGVHRGSAGRVATAVTSFPGIGGADRSASQEGAVVEATLAQLLDVELTPFVAVADVGAGRAEGVTDAVVTSHVRYRGIQQQTDGPLSLDGGGLRYLWAQVPALSAWRDGGGVVISAGLGLPAVRRFVDPSQTTFNVRLVVREALLAGNDILNLSAFGAAADPAADRETQTANIRAARDWLVQAYAEEEDIRQAVDSAALRILALKLKLYREVMGPEEATLEGVQVDPEALMERVGQGSDQIGAVSTHALTRIASAGAASGQGGPPGAASAVPQPGERLLWVVDSRTVSECAACEPYASLDPAEFLNLTWRIYGTDNSGVALVRRREDVSAITFAELKAWLQSTGRVAANDTLVLAEPLTRARQREVADLMRRADWVIFALREVNTPSAPGSDALKLFLQATAADSTDRPQRWVAFALDAPYYLDTTEIAKLTAYYAVFARTPAFVQTVVRAVFGDVPPGGASPVSVPGAGYELAKQLEPAPEQALALELVDRNPDAPIERNAPFQVRTSAILDANGHPVRDGTRVSFRRYHRAENVYLPDVPSATKDGRATAEMRNDKEGNLEIRAALENGLVSDALEVTISRGLFSVIAPPGNLPQVPVDWNILLLSLAAMLLAGVLVYGADGEASRVPGRWLRLVLLGLAWGLAGYLLVAAGGLQLALIPGLDRLWPENWNPAYQAPAFSFAFALLPVVPTLVRALRTLWSS